MVGSFLVLSDSLSQEKGKKRQDGKQVFFAIFDRTLQFKYTCYYLLTVLSIDNLSLFFSIFLMILHASKAASFRVIFFFYFSEIIYHFFPIILVCNKFHRFLTYRLHVNVFLDEFFMYKA